MDTTKTTHVDKQYHDKPFVTRVGCSDNLLYVFLYPKLSRVVVCLFVFTHLNGYYFMLRYGNDV